MSTASVSILRMESEKEEGRRGSAPTPSPSISRALPALPEERTLMPRRMLRVCADCGVRKAPGGVRVWRKWWDLSASGGLWSRGRKARAAPWPLTAHKATAAATRSPWMRSQLCGSHLRDGCWAMF